MRVAVHDEDFELVLGVEGKMCGGAPCEPVFFKSDLADVSSRLGQSGLKADGSFAARWNRSELLFFGLSIDAQLNEQIFDLLIAKISNDRFEIKRQVNADPLTSQSDFSDGAVERRLFSADVDGFERYRRVVLLQRRDGKLIPTG